VRSILYVLAGLLVAVAALALAGFFVLRPPPPLPLPEQGVLLRDVKLVLPGDDGWRHSHQRVVVEGGRITGIGPSRPNDRDAFSGHTVIPGLADLHVHFPPSSVPGQAELFSLLFLAHGVTAVRDAGDTDGTSSDPVRAGLRSGAFPGPTVVSCGPFVDGDPPLWKNSLVARTPEEGRAAVREVAERGDECVKAYDELEAPVLDAIRDEAHRLALKVIGHTPRRVPFERAQLDDVQHLTGVQPTGPGIAPPFPEVLRGWLDVDDAWIARRASESLLFDITHTPTLVTIDRMRAARDFEKLRASLDARLLPRFYRDVIWSPVDGMSPARGFGPSDFDWLDRAYANMARMVKGLHDADVELHTGTDTLVAFVVPGAALHRELRLWVAAGISPGEALAASSRVSAAYIGPPGAGTLEVGAPADLAIFREDPTRSLDALETLSGVVHDGRLYTRNQLDAQLARYREQFDGTLYDAVVTPVVRRVVAATLLERDESAKPGAD